MKICRKSNHCLSIVHYAITCGAITSISALPMISHKVGESTS